MIIDTIITDMDDTLFNEAGKISAYTLEVVRECLKKGIRVIPASGRTQSSMDPYMRQMDTKLPYIACNGAQIVNADHTLREELTLPIQTARKICTYLQENDCYAHVYRNEYFYYTSSCSQSEYYQKSSGLLGEAVGNLAEFLSFETPKILIVGEPERIAEIYPEIMKRFAEEATFSVSRPNYIEIVPPGVTKGAAIKRLAGSMAITPESTFVFGDSLNDISMLEFTKNSVAMGNARDEVKAVAGYICGSNGEDGMAKFIKEHILQ